MTRQTAVDEPEPAKRRPSALSNSRQRSPCGFGSINRSDLNIGRCVRAPADEAPTTVKTGLAALSPMLPQVARAA